MRKVKVQRPASVNDVIIIIIITIIFIIIKLDITVSNLCGSQWFVLNNLRVCIHLMKSLSRVIYTLYNIKHDFFNFDCLFVDS
jgi:hypothetical protein